MRVRKDLAQITYLIHRYVYGWIRFLHILQVEQVRVGIHSFALVISYIHHIK